MNEVKINVYCSSNKLIDYLVYNKICYKSFCCCEDYCTLIVCFDDYKRINRRFKCNIVRYFGKVGLITFIKFHKYLIISFIISMLLLHLLTNTIFEIKVYTSNEKVKQIIINDLNKYGINTYKKKKSFDEISVIKDKILNNNKDYLEWIEIKEKGCIYEVYVTLRIKENKRINELSESSIYASKDGVIKHIVVYSGTKIKEVNDYVHEGDVLISGNVMKNEEVSYTTNALGEVYAEVWYIVNVSVPFTYTEYVSTGKIINRYYLSIFNHEFTITGKYDSNNVFSKKELIIDKPYLFFKVYKEEKEVYEYKTINVNKESAYNEALKRSEDKIKDRLKSGEYIISKKVLKKEVNSSKINLEVFFKVYENIGYTSNIDQIGEKNAESDKGSN